MVLKYKKNGCTHYLPYDGGVSANDDGRVYAYVDECPIRVAELGAGWSVGELLGEIDWVFEHNEPLLDFTPFQASKPAVSALDPDDVPF